MNFKDEGNKTEETFNNRIFLFPRGIPGMEHITKYSIEPMSETPLFFTLQSLEDSKAGIILVDPFPFFPGYGFDLSKSDQDELIVKDPADLLVLTTVTVYNEKFYTNLIAPVILNTGNKLAKQIILPNMDEQDLRVALNIPAAANTG